MDVALNFGDVDSGVEFGIIAFLNAFKLIEGTILYGGSCF